MVGRNTVFARWSFIIMVSVVVTSLGCAPLLSPSMFERNRIRRVVPPLAGAVVASLTGGFLLAGLSQYERKAAKAAEEFGGAGNCPTQTAPRPPACEDWDAAMGRAELFRELAGSSLALSCVSAVALAGVVAVAFNVTRGGLVVGMVR